MIIDEQQRTRRCFTVTLMLMKFGSFRTLRSLSTREEARKTSHVRAKPARLGTCRG